MASLKLHNVFLLQFIICSIMVFFLHEDRYFGNHSAMVSVMKGVLPFHRMHVQEVQPAYHSVWKLTTNEHICFKAHVLRINPISY